MTIEDKEIKKDRFPSNYLEKLGIHNMLEFYEKVQEEDINLGKLEVNKLSSTQLNSLLNLNKTFKNFDCFIYLDNENNVIFTSDYRDQFIKRDTKFKNGWITKQIDFVFGEIDDTKENK